MTDVMRKGTFGHPQKVTLKTRRRVIDATAVLETTFFTLYVSKTVFLLALFKILRQNDII
jgi:uncharacterized protein Smg (DUF494 family)